MGLILMWQNGLIGSALIGIGYVLNNKNIMNGESFSAYGGYHMAKGKLTRKDINKDSWYNGQQILNVWKSYDDFLSYLETGSKGKDITQESISAHEDQMWRQFQRGMKRWGDDPKDADTEMWNWIENRPWKFGELHHLPWEQAQHLGRHYHDGSERIKQETRQQYVPHKTTGKPTTKTYTEWAYYKPKTKEVVWKRHHYNRWHSAHGTHPPLEEGEYPLFMDNMSRSVFYIDTDYYGDSRTPEQKKEMRKKDVKQYKEWQKEALINLKPADIAKLETFIRSKANPPGQYRMVAWDATARYTGETPIPANRVAELGYVYQAVLYATSFPKIKALTKGKRGGVKLLNKPLILPSKMEENQRQLQAQIDSALEQNRIRNLGQTKEEVIENATAQFDRIRGDGELWNQLMVNTYDFAPHLTTLKKLYDKAEYMFQSPYKARELTEAEKQMKEAKKAMREANAMDAQKMYDAQLKQYKDNLEASVQYQIDRAKKDAERKLDYAKERLQAAKKASQDFKKP